MCESDNDRNCEECYRIMYTYLFNCLTDAIAQIEGYNYGLALEILRNAQLRAEDQYLRCEEDGGEGGEAPRLPEIRRPSPLTIGPEDDTLQSLPKRH